MRKKCARLSKEFMNIKSAVFRNVTPCSSVHINVSEKPDASIIKEDDLTSRIIPENVDSMFLQTSIKFLPVYTGSQPRRRYWRSLSWKVHLSLLLLLHIRIKIWIGLYCCFPEFCFDICEVKFVTLIMDIGLGRTETKLSHTVRHLSTRSRLIDTALA